MDVLDVGFVEADSTNLPRIDVVMIAKFFACNPNFFSAECRNIKTALSTRESYGDEAIGYVQLKREAQTCIVKCIMAPEPKVCSSPYSCTLIVDEQEVKSVVCHDCPEGSCMHAVGFLMWCHRRSEEPPCTTVECYWRKSTLAEVGSPVEILLAKDTTKIYNPLTAEVCDKRVFEDFMAECKKRKISSCQILKHEPGYDDEQLNKLSLHYLMCKFNEGLDCNTFLTNISDLVNGTNIKNAEIETRYQHKTRFWYELKYGRITATKCYKVSKSITDHGSLVAAILAARTPLTPAMRRLQVLKENVMTTVEKKLGQKIEKCGLFIPKAFPMIVGSPDGVFKKSTLVEIKCPTSLKPLQNYIEDGIITNKYFTQVQIKMFCAKADNTCFCVASSNFEKDNNVHIIKVQYDQEFVIELLDNVVSFWKENVYPVLYESTRI